MRCDIMFQLKTLHAVATSSVHMGHNESMQGVGIVSVIVDFDVGVAEASSRPHRRCAPQEMAKLNLGARSGQP